MIQEIEWIEKCVKDSKSPVVFTHNDFRQSNIEEEFDSKLTFIDYEYSGYTFRAMDFGIFFTEFNRTSLLFQEFPEEEKVINFLEEYHRESIEIFGKNFSDDKRNSLKSLLIETKVSYIFQVLYMVLFLNEMIGYNENSFFTNAFGRTDEFVINGFNCTMKI